MSYAFFKIESDKTRRIWVLFAALVVFYFVGGVYVRNVYRAVSERTFLKGFLFHVPVLIVFESFRQIVTPHLPSPHALRKILAFAFLAAGAHWWLATQGMLRRLMTAMGAQPLDPEDRYHIQFRNILEELSTASGGPAIEGCVVNSRCLNAFALADFGGRAVIGVTEGLLASLNRAQLEAVAAHEAAHIRWGDCLTVTITCSLAGGFAGAARKELARVLDWVPLWRVIFLVASSPLMVLDGVSFLLNVLISREKETRADATAVRLTRDPLSLAEALHLIHRNHRGDGLAMESMAPVFIVSPDRRGENGGLFPALFSSHPPTAGRIKSLLAMANAGQDALEAGARGRAPQEPETALPGEQHFTGVGCPCGGSLEMVYDEGSPLWRCQGCRGHLVKRTKVPRLLARENAVFSEAIRTKTQHLLNRIAGALPPSPETPKPCPACARPMTRQPFTAVFPYHVEIDLCAPCDSFWFDKDELEVIQCLCSQKKNC
jgi:heat shock protein HtpX